MDGRLDQSLEAGDRLITRGEELGSPLQARVMAGRAEHALLLLGRANEALDRFDERYKEETSLTLRAGRARLLAHAGRLDEASASITRLWAGAEEREGQLEVAILSHLVTLLDTALVVGDRELVDLLAEKLAPHAGLALSYQFWACTPARLLGEAAVYLGKRDEARAYYLQAIELASKIRFRPEVALARLALAELLLGHYPGERTDALVHLDFAIGEFRAMKMQPSLERALRSRDLLKA